MNVDEFLKVLKVGRFKEIQAHVLISTLKNRCVEVVTQEGAVLVRVHKGRHVQDPVLDQASFHVKRCPSGYDRAVRFIEEYLPGAQ